MPDVQIKVHTHEDDLELYARGRLEPSVSSKFEAHLLVCQSCQARFSQCIGIQLSLDLLDTTRGQHKHERSEPRFRTGEQAALQELSPFSLDRLRVAIVDISKHGLGILATRAILPRTIVQIRIKRTVEIGEVRYCSVLGNGQYRIGVRVAVCLFQYAKRGTDRTHGGCKQS